MTGPVQLLVYRFGAEAGFEGHVVGALERMESGGTLRVLDVLFVGREPTGELSAIDLHGSGAGGLVAPLVGFRLDMAERRRSTRRALATHQDVIEALGATLAPGDALIALLVGHEWARALADAVQRTGGAQVANVFVAPPRLSELADELIAAAAAAP
jgi:hypothetical protein